MEFSNRELWLLLQAMECAIAYTDNDFSRDFIDLKERLEKHATPQDVSVSDTYYDKNHMRIDK